MKANPNLELRFQPSKGEDGVIDFCLLEIGDDASAEDLVAVPVDFEALDKHSNAAATFSLTQPNVQRLYEALKVSKLRFKKEKDSE